ncbi:MAG: sigma 54-interacting transcriptional regulator [Desulfobacterales bacterium]|nr:sigma 54-interacting transcriptional regulator [Desulfobacterales bacterium]
MKPDKSFPLERIVATEILKGVPHGIAILDTNLRIAEMNSFLEVLTGFSSSDARGVFADFILRSNIGNDIRQFREVLEKEECLSLSGDIINQQHKKIPVHFTVSPLRSESGGPLGLLVFLEDMSALQSIDQKRYSFGGAENILGHSPKMREVFELMPVLAQTDASVLITGETGTGKDMVAEAIHEESKRSPHPFIKINCGALPEALLESELFGHVRGAFTGAVKDKPGLFRMAQDGTIFLTEIGDLPLPLQIKLLSVLDDKEFFPVGAVKKTRVNVRIIAATHRPLRELVSKGKFREDLFYRLNVLRLHLPSLREREGDIRLLLDHFLQEFNSNLHKKIKEFSGKALKTLMAYSYPGNVRELRNIVEYSVNICQEKKIKLKCLPKYLLSPAIDQNENARVNEPSEIVSNTTASKITEPSPPMQGGGDGGGWNEIEKEMILEAMKKAKGNRTETARNLGWGRTTLWRKMKRYELT